MLIKIMKHSAQKSSQNREELPKLLTGGTERVGEVRRNDTVRKKEEYSWYSDPAEPDHRLA
jgi:hypothetical protein